MTPINFEIMSARLANVLKIQGVTTWEEIPSAKDLMKLRHPKAAYQAKYKTAGVDYWINLNLKCINELNHYMEAL